MALLSTQMIALGCAGGLLVVVLIMAFTVFIAKRNQKPKDTNVDRNLIETNANKVEVLITLAGDNAEAVADLKKLQEKLRFLPAVLDDKVYAIDNKIKNLLDDLKIALTKSGGEDNKKTETIFKDIDLLIAERGAIVNL